MDQAPQGGTWSRMSGTARDVVQARDVTGGIHFHRPAAAVLRPRQLPAPPAAFVNRNEALDRLDAAAMAPGLPFAVIVGMPGVGKTSLALHWSHRNQDRYPDGQLYLDLHGYGQGEPVGPLRALWRLLLALGTARDELPVDVDESAAQYRSLVAGQRMLIVLDNAVGADQVRPLLPGPGESLVIVTSRAHMTNLVTREGARKIIVEVLPEDHAVELLGKVTGTERSGDSKSALAELARLCAHLPLSLRIAGEHAVRRSWTPLEDLIEELRGQPGLWEMLTVEDAGQSAETLSARSVFAWSYLTLPREAARALRLLALHPGPEFGDSAAAVLTATTDPRLALSILVGAHLLEQHAADRYQFHDLVRSYAMDRARREESPEESRHASRELLTWYLRSADAAQSWINPGEPRVALQGVTGDAEPEAFGSYEAALRWFERERGNLVAAVSSAREQGWHEIAWRLAVVLRGIFMRFNPFEDWITTSEAGLRSAEQAGDRRAQADLLESLGMAFAQSHDLDRAAAFHRRALEARRELGDRPGTALSLNDLGLVQLRRHQWAQAAATFEEALEIFDALGDEHWRPVLRANLAEALIGAGQHMRAEELVGDALATFRERADAGGEGNALRLLSMAGRSAGDLDAALGHATRATEIATAYGIPMWEGYWLIELGTVQYLSGRATGALTSFERAALLQHRIGDRAREALALAGMAEVLTATGREAEGSERAAEALRLVAIYSDPASEELRARLRAIE